MFGALVALGRATVHRHNASGHSAVQVSFSQSLVERTHNWSFKLVPHLNTIASLFTICRLISSKKEPSISLPLVNTYCACVCALQLYAQWTAVWEILRKKDVTSSYQVLLMIPAAALHLVCAGVAAEQAHTKWPHISLLFSTYMLLRLENVLCW